MRDFLQKIKTRLSGKGKTVSGIFIAFLQSTKNFAHFENEDQLHSLNTWKGIHSKKCGYLNPRKLLF